ncbi:MAG: LOG family protein, partial [Planctomycetota bacterium]
KELRIVEDMRVRKHVMLSESQGLVALPGGSGTLEELFEAITLKRLGIYLHPIVLVNTNNFFDPLLHFMEHVIAERFMDERHALMWSVVSTPDDVPSALDQATEWSPAAREFAAVRISDAHAMPPN